MAAARIHFQSNVLIFMIIFLLVPLRNLAIAIAATKSSNSGGGTGGLSIDLIHRDSPNSPLYKPHETPFERYNNNIFLRTLSRLNTLNMSPATYFYPNNVVQSNVSTANGEYVMKFSIGTPPLLDIYGIVDTGSDLMWVQCLPCVQCYKQVKPIYNPTSSSSYKELSCQSEQCHLLDTVSCSSQQLCNYTYGYADSSLTKGVLATERITFENSNNFFDNVVFGCGHNNTGVFNENEMGLVGLGRTRLSLASQILSQLGANKFSYCLVPFHTDPSIASKMYFGNGSEVSGGGVVSTSLVSKEDKTYYFVTLEGISVGNLSNSSKLIPYYNSSGAISKGNMFIDTGAPPTLLPKDFYNRLEEQVRNAIKLTPSQDPRLGSQLCYKTQSMAGIAPILTAHFDGGAKVPLIHTSTFIPPPVEGVFCFAMQPIDGDVGIFGNFAQSDLFIGYDFDSQMVSFKPTDCTKQ
ncbi:hypothetical protein AB3S75_033619 [Citrus x aurantiifolia]